MSGSSYRAENVIPRETKIGCREIRPEGLCRVHLENTRTGQDQDDMRRHYTTKISRVCDASMPRRRQHKNRWPALWWNTEISELRNCCIKQRRKAQRARKRRMPESCSELPSSKARGNAGKLCVPMSIETHGTCPIA